MSLPTQTNLPTASTAWTKYITKMLASYRSTAAGLRARATVLAAKFSRNTVAINQGLQQVQTYAAQFMFMDVANVSGSVTLAANNTFYTSSTLTINIPSWASTCVFNVATLCPFYMITTGTTAFAGATAQYIVNGVAQAEAFSLLVNEYGTVLSGSSDAPLPSSVAVQIRFRTTDITTFAKKTCYYRMDAYAQFF